MLGDRIHYPFQQMTQGASDIAATTRQVAELQDRFQTAMRNLFAAWQSEKGSVQLQQVQQLWVQSNEAINQMRGRQGVALDDAQIRMRQADSSSAASLEI